MLGSFNVMPHRFTIKVLLFLLIGLVVCLLLFLNMVKTNREVETLIGVEEALQDQAKTLRQIQETLADPPDETPLGLMDESDSGEGARVMFRDSFPVLPKEAPASDITFSSPSPAVNRLGRDQQWQTAPDSQLPEDFAPGGTIIHIRNAEPATLTPFVARDSYANDIHADVFEKLCWRDLEPPFHYVPGLARSWVVSDDGLELIFHLFPNARWSDGQPVTADDVIFTLDLVLNERVDAPMPRSLLADNVADYIALDRHTVRFRMRRPYFNAVGICGNLLWILPRHIYGEFDSETYNSRIGDLCVGSGPWLVESWDRGRQLVLKRNENYWGPRPALQKQVLRFITGELAELQEFWAGNADIIGPTEEQWIVYADDSRLKERGEAISYYTPLRGYYFFGYNLRLGKFADKRVRQALTMLLDRQAMIDTLRGGLGRIVTGPFYFGSDQYDTTIEPWPYDPDRARQLLAEAGWSDTNGDGVIDKDLDGDGAREPFQINFLAARSNLHERYQRYVQAQFKQAGIKVNLDQLEWSVFEQRLVSRDFEMIVLAWTGNPETDAFAIWHSSQVADRGSNIVGFVNDEADRLIEQARQTMEYEPRMELWRELHRLLHVEQPYTFLFTGPRLTFIDQRFKNVQRRSLRLYTSEWYVGADLQRR